MERVRFEAALRDLLEGDDDIVLKVSRIGGTATVALTDWPDDRRRQRYGAAPCLAAALRKALAD